MYLYIYIYRYLYIHRYLGFWGRMHKRLFKVVAFGDGRFMDRAQRWVGNLVFIIEVQQHTKIHPFEVYICWVIQ